MHNAHHFKMITITDDCGKKKKVKCWQKHIQVMLKKKRIRKPIWRQQFFYGSCYKLKNGKGGETWD